MSSADFAAVHALLRASHARARYGAPPQHAHQQRSAVHNVLERLRTWQRHEIVRQLPPEADKGSTSSQSAACGGARISIATQVSAGFLPFAQQLLRNLRTLGLLHTVVALAEDAASTRELARSEGLWQGENATASLWRGFRERHARTLLGGCEAMPCASGNATS